MLPLLYTRESYIWFISFGLVVLAVSSLRSQPDAHARQVFYNSVNRHYYERVDSAGISWEQARSAAEHRRYSGLRGHLVTITSASENAFVFSLGDLISYQFGGYQDESSRDFQEPQGGWKWITGEPWDYEVWSIGEPNDGGGGTENYLVGWFGDGWNDGQGIRERGYVVEYEPEEDQ